MNRLLKNKIDLILLCLITLLAPFFLYKLGQSSLVSWDEAWYGDISKTIVQTGNLFNLVYNGSPFSEKPPGGFWVEALSFKLFGISEFSARLPQALSGLLTLYLVYLLGRKLFNRVVGFVSAISLSSAFWFLYRSRSGNLDIILTLFFILTIYLALLASKKRKYFIAFSVSLAFLAMIKGIIFIFALIPTLSLIFWKSNCYKPKDFIFPIFLTFFPFGIWIILTSWNDPSLGLWHLSISLRSSSLQNDFGYSLNLYRDYLHSGMGKWFWPGILGVVLGLILKQKRFLILISFFVFYSAQFLFSSEVHIWHLIPLYPFLVLLFYGSSYLMLERKGFNKIIASFLLIFFCLYFTFTQLKVAWYQFIDIPAYVSDEAILSKEAGLHQGDILIDGDFDPAAAFYSGRTVSKLFNPDLNYLFKNRDNFLLITNDWRLEKEKINPESYQILKKDRDKVLIKK